MKANKMKILVSAAVAFCAAALYAELPDPIAWFDIGNATDTSVPDASGNGHALTLGLDCGPFRKPFEPLMSARYAAYAKLGVVKRN